MVDVSKVSAWVLKAVADIAAFGGKLGRIEKGAEQKALSTLLAGCDKEEDKEYIQGFMIEKCDKKEVAGARKDVNVERKVEVEINPAFYENAIGPKESMSPEEYEQRKATIEEEYASAEMYYDEDGNHTGNIIRGKDGNITSYSEIEQKNGLHYVKQKDVRHNVDSEGVFDPKTREALDIKMNPNNQPPALPGERTKDSAEQTPEAVKRFNDGIYDPYLEGYGWSSPEDAMKIHDDMYNIYEKIEARLQEIKYYLEHDTINDVEVGKLEKEREELIRHEIDLKERMESIREDLNAAPAGGGSYMNTEEGRVYEHPKTNGK